VKLRNSEIAAYVLLVLPLLVTTTLPATIRVPSERLTIQEGINAAVDGDTVLVADGVYVGNGNSNIRFGGKGILVVSQHGASATIVDASQIPTVPRQVFIFDAAEDSTSILDGFTITGGYNNSEVWPGGAGVKCYQSSPNIRNCIVKGNTVFTTHPLGAGGAGVFTFEGAPVIENCTFIKNHGNYAAAILSINSRLRIRNCLISANVSIWSGPPVEYVADYFAATFECCNLYGNSPGDWIGQIAGLVDSNGNMALDPLLCDTASGDLSIMSNSPCAPSNNTCGLLIGALSVGCEPVGVEYQNSSHLPSTPNLSNNYPNPFNGTTQIRFSLPQHSSVKLTVVDVLGREVKTLAKGEWKAGTYTATWDAEKSSSGVYFCVLEANGIKLTRKMVLLK